MIGLFCVNFFFHTTLSEFLGAFINPSASENDSISEKFVDNAEDLMIGALEEVKRIVYNDLSISSSNKNKEIVSLLYQRGIFNLKDSVITISNHLGISKNTVYMHLRNINKQWFYNKSKIKGENKIFPFQSFYISDYFTAVSAFFSDLYL